MGRDLGKMGESVLRGWGAQIRIVVNSSADQDEAGWDFFLEWPIDHQEAQPGSLPLDRTPAPLQCLVQVKTTASRRRRRSVKLSNWWRFVQNPLPTFFLVLEFGKSNNCQRAFLIHVGNSHIERVLKRVRELAVDNLHVKLHEHTIDFTWGKEHEIRHSGIGLTSAIRAHTGSELRDYVERKQRFLAEVGYDDVGQQLRVTPRFPDGWHGDPDELLVDFGLGLVPHLEIEAGEIVDIRFGIPAVLPERLESGELRILDRTPVGRGTVRIRDLNSENEVRLAADVYVPQGIRIQREHRKIRYALPFVDLFISFGTSGSMHTKIHLPSDQDLHPLADFQPLADLIGFFNTATLAESNDLEITASIDDQRLSAGRLAGAIAPSEYHVEWAERAKNAWAAARFFEIERDVRTTTSDLVSHWRQLHVIALGIQAIRPPQLQIAYNYGELDTELPWCLPFAATARLGAYQVQLAFVVIGVGIPTGEVLDGKPMYSFQSNEVQRLYQRLYCDPETPERSDQDLFDDLTNQFAREMQVITLNNFPWIYEEL